MLEIIQIHLDSSIYLFKMVLIWAELVVAQNDPIGIVLGMLLIALCGLFWIAFCMFFLILPYAIIIGLIILCFYIFFV
ncbi:MAG: hypothetical protein FWE02_03710 [Defluviitaleaceae bacterium]|nr:hypothetical protein [Defluviitaleaceae bacterium]